MAAVTRQDIDVIEKALETDFKAAAAAEKKKEAAAAESQDETSKETPQLESAAAAQTMTPADEKMTKGDGNETTETVISKDEEIKALLEKRKATDKNDQELLKNISKSSKKGVREKKRMERHKKYNQSWNSSKASRKGIADTLPKLYGDLYSGEIFSRSQRTEWKRCSPEVRLFRRD